MKRVLWDVDTEADFMLPEGRLYLLHKLSRVDAIVAALQS